MYNKSRRSQEDAFKTKTKGTPLLHSIHKIIVRWIIDLNVKGKIIKFLGDNKGEYLWDLKRKGFLKQVIKNINH